MKASEIKHNLNSIVRYNGARYRLTAGIIRADKRRGHRYTVELEDLRARSVCVCPIDSVELLDGGGVNG